jgi:hypothetical protein
MLAQQHAKLRGGGSCFFCWSGQMRARMVGAAGQKQAMVLAAGTDQQQNLVSLALRHFIHPAAGQGLCNSSAMRDSIRPSKGILFPPCSARHKAQSGKKAGAQTHAANCHLHYSISIRHAS